MIVHPLTPHYVVMIPVQLEYSAPAGCPTQAEFVALVENRGANFDRPGPGTRARGMVVKLRSQESEHQGSLQLQQDDGATDARELHARTCSEVAEGLAIVAAIALRGAEAAAVTPETSASTPVIEPRPAPVAALPGEPKAAAETRLRSIGVWGDEQLPVTSGPLLVRHELVPTLSAGAVFGAVPGLVLPRYDLTLLRANYITTPKGSSFLIGNVFGVRWSYLGKATKRDAGYSTEIEGLNAGVMSCSSLSYDSGGFVALLCASFMVGVTHLETKSASNDYQQSKDFGFGGAGLELNLRYNIGRHFHLNLAGGADIWASKLTAEKADGSELFHSRLFNGNVQLGIGIHL